MATPKDTPPGLEVDEHGNPIPFEARTESDKQKVRENIAAAMHPDPDNPNTGIKREPAAKKD